MYQVWLINTPNSQVERLPYRFNKQVLTACRCRSAGCEKPHVWYATDATELLHRKNRVGSSHRHQHKHAALKVTAAQVLTRVAESVAHKEPEVFVGIGLLRKLDPIPEVQLNHFLHRTLKSELGILNEFLLCSTLPLVACCSKIVDIQTSFKIRSKGVGFGNFEKVGHFTSDSATLVSTTVGVKNKAFGTSVQASPTTAHFRTKLFFSKNAPPP